MNTPRTSRGLTLVELLVTIVLVAMATSLVVGGIGQGSALLARVSADQGVVYQELMAREWIRQSVESAVAPVDQERNFEGSPTEMRFSSYRPLLGSEGVATLLGWSAVNGALEYTEDTQSFRVESLPPLAGFEYQDTELAWHDSWPVGEATGLPERVALVFAGGDAERMEIAIRTRRAPFMNADEAMYERE